MVVLFTTELCHAATNIVPGERCTKLGNHFLFRFERIAHFMSTSTWNWQRNKVQIVERIAFGCQRVKSGGDE